MHHIDPVRHQIGQLSAAKIPEMPPLIEALGAERLVRRGPKPPLPIEFVHRDGRVIALGGVLIPIGLHEGDLTKTAGVDDLLAEHPVVPASLLRSRLDNLLRGLDGFDHLLPFLDRVGDWFFDVDVLARGNRVQCDRLVPVIGRADHDRIDLAIVQDAPVIRHFGRRRRGNLSCLQEARLVDVAHRHHFVTGQTFEQLHQASGAATRANHADANAIVRALDARTRHTRRQRQSGSRGQEGATVNHGNSPLRGDIVTRNERTPGSVVRGAGSGGFAVRGFAVRGFAVRRSRIPDPGSRQRRVYGGMV